MNVTSCAPSTATAATAAAAVAVILLTVAAVAAAAVLHIPAMLMIDPAGAGGEQVVRRRPA